MKQEVGTARELDMQVGDVVDWAGGRDTVLSVRVVPEDPFKGCIKLNLIGHGEGIFDDEIFTIISRAATPETGTLAELDVKPGDVVEDTYDGTVFTVSIVDGMVHGDTKWPGGSFTQVDSWNLNGLNTWRIISRATPQRYVVATDTETTIATRAEAEDLVTSGGVLAVYKLGDEVGITTTVTLD